MPYHVPVPVELPAPDFDTGWIDFPRLTYPTGTPITHNLGTREIMAVGWVRHKFPYWAEPVEIAFGAYFSHWTRSIHYGLVIIDENTIEISQYEHHPTEVDAWVRLRIWKLS